MTSRIVDGTGSGNAAKVTSDNRLRADSISAPISSERSRLGKLWGCGSGGITLDAAMSFAPVLWLKNTGTANDWYVQKLIFGWNGGSTNHDRTVLSFIKYQATVPTGANTAITAAIENISLSGTTSPVTNSDFTGYKWDGTGTDGMTGGASGFLQIPNRIAKGNTSIQVDGEIILGPGDSMQFEVIPEEAGLFHVSVVFYEVATGKERGDE